MAYDNTKLDEAIRRWIERDCDETFGETYAGDLLASFESFCADTGAMKRSPGRVAFGKALARREFEKRKVCGLTYWAGIVLTAPPEVSVPRENAKKEDTQRLAARREKIAARQAEEARKEQERRERAKTVKRRMAGETKEKVASAGQFITDGPD